MTRIAIGVPVYNGALTLPETLRCIQQQHHRDIDVLISIDGGDQGSWAAVQPFLADSRFRCIQQNERLGWAGNLTRTFSACEASHFCYWQQDDLASHNYLGALLQVHQQWPDTGVAYTDVQWFGEQWGREQLPSIDAPSRRDRVLAYLESQHWIPLRGLIRTELLRDLPAHAHLCQHSPWENGFLAHLAACAPLRRCEAALYFKRAHHSQWGSSFEKRPLAQRRADWVTRASALLQVLDQAGPADLNGDSTERVVARFAHAPSGQFVDHHYTNAPAPARFVRDALALCPLTWSARIADWARLGNPVACTEAAAQRTRTNPVHGRFTWSLAASVETSAAPSGEVFLGFGWSHRETWGVWSEVERPSLWLPQIDHPGHLRLQGRHHGVPGQRARVGWQFGNGVGGETEIPCGTVCTIDVPVGPGQTQLWLLLPDAVSPRQLRQSTDERQLGLGLEQLHFEPGPG